MKNSLDRLNGELEMAQEGFCELKVRSIEIIQYEELREENWCWWWRETVLMASRIMSSSLTYMYLES